MTQGGLPTFLPSLLAGPQVDFGMGCGERHALSHLSVMTASEFKSDGHGFNV